MRDFNSGLFAGLFIGVFVTVLGCLLIVNRGKGGCEKDLPRTQECTLQWVRPEVSK